MTHSAAKGKFFSPSPEQFLSDRHEDAAAAPQPAGGPPRAIATPCVQVCIVDGPSGLCLGCYRTLAEIGGWRGLTDAARAAIMAELPGRGDRVDPAKLAPAAGGNLP